MLRVSKYFQEKDKVNSTKTFLKPVTKTAYYLSSQKVKVQYRATHSNMCFIYPQ